MCRYDAQTSNHQLIQANERLLHFDPKSGRHVQNPVPRYTKW